jgi:hypothetical protein
MKAIPEYGKTAVFSKVDIAKFDALVPADEGVDEKAADDGRRENRKKSVGATLALYSFEIWHLLRFRSTDPIPGLYALSKAANPS